MHAFLLRYLNTALIRFLPRNASLSAGFFIGAFRYEGCVARRLRHNRQITDRSATLAVFISESGMVGNIFAHSLIFIGRILRSEGCWQSGPGDIG
jgi:hypothetical protein